MRVVIASPGIGIVNRGYEVFALQLAEALRAEGVDVHVLAGGPTPHERRRVLTVRRDHAIARWAARLARKQPHSIEQYVFAAMSLPHLRRLEPDVVVASESVLFALWDRCRGPLRLSRTAFILTNGGSREPPFRHVDAVIHHATDLYASAHAREPGRSHHRLPCPVAVLPWEDVDRMRQDRTSVLNALGIPTQRFVCVAIGSIDRHVKRSTHVATEIADAAHSVDVHLLMLGRVSREDRALLEELRSLLGDRLSIREVAPEEVAACVAAADLHVSASLREGFGRVFVEAQAVGTNSVVHDTQRSRVVLDGLGVFVDAEVPGSMAAAVRHASTASDLPEPRTLWESALRSGWSEWAPRYRDTLEAIARAASADGSPDRRSA